MNVYMTNSDVDVQSSMLRYNFDFWRRWNAMNLVISRCCFAEDGKEMYQEL